MHFRVYVILLMILWWLSPTNSYGQQPVFTVKGKIVDEISGQPLEFATISVKRMRDSSLVSGTITNNSGEFQLNDLPPGGYMAEIGFLGYETIKQRLILRPQGSLPITDLGTVKMKISAKLLKVAEISADKSFIVNNIDKKTYNTEQLAVTAGGNVKDVLENIPSVEVDADGNVSLRGNENVTILIDGRPSGLTGSGGKSLLESIPASAIENVEVITNPSAKYDPDGVSGIINIVTKKNKLVGLTGNVGVNTSFENRYGGNLSLSYRKGPWNLYANYAYNKDDRKFTGTSYRETYFSGIKDILRQNETESNDRYNHNVKAGVDFNINEHNTISASVLYNTGKEDKSGIVIYRSFDQFLVMDSLYNRSSRGDEDNLNIDADLAFKHYFKQKGRIVNILGTVSVDDNDEFNAYSETGYVDEITPVPSYPDFQKDNTKNKNLIYTASADYEHPIGETRKVEAGLKSIIRNYDSDFMAEDYNDTTGTYVNDINRTNHFVFSDQVHALYAQYRQSIKKFGFQLGVRSEYATTQSELVTTNEIFDKDYFSIFPSAFVTWKPEEKSQLKASYSRRINRPGRRALNPFASYDDPLNIRKGNPFLDPEYTDSYELEFTRLVGKINLTATGYARFTTDYIQRFRQVTPEGITITTFENLSSARNYGLELIANGNPFKWWNVTVSGNMFRNEIDATNLEDNLSSVSLSVSGRIFTTFKLPAKTDLQISYFYRAPNTVPQGTIKSMQFGSVAISKKVLSDRGVVSLRVSDPLNSQRFRFEFEGDNYYQDFTRKRQSRIFTVSFNYRFGELRDRDARPKRDQAPREDMDFEG